MTEVVRTEPGDSDPDAIARAAACLRGGGLVAFPTETVYGLGAHALDPAAVRRIFEAKGRPSTDPLIVHVTSLDAAASLVAAMPDAARLLASRFWPGPLTLVLPRSPRVPDEVTAGLDTVAIRVPAHPVARALLDVAGIPVAAPSANLFSRPSPTRAAHVLDDLDGRIDMILDAGPTTVGVESTVLDLSGAVPTVLRPGAVTLEMLRAILPTVLSLHGQTGDASSAQLSPGMLARHYAPRTPMTLYMGEPDAQRRAMVSQARASVRMGLRVGILAADDTANGFDRHELDGTALVLGSLGDGDAAIAARLYDALRQLDAAHLDIILACDAGSADGLGRAIHDRLRRAAAHITLV